MTTNQLEYFITVAECLNFTEAGKKHFISQTAITQRIQALEEDLGVQLFNRTKRKVELTPAGKVFFYEARALLEREKVALDRVEKAATGFSGNLTIGYVKGFEYTNFNGLLKQFYEDNINVSFQLYRQDFLDLLLHIHQKKLDIAFTICYDNTKLDKFEYINLGSSPLYAVLYPTHPYAQLTSIRRYDLRNDNYLLTKFYHDPSAKGFMIPTQFASSGFIPEILATSSDIETILLLVAAGIGISILPEHAVKHLFSSPNHVFIPLIGEHEHVDLKAVWLKENTNPALLKFVESIKTIYAPQ